MPSPRRMIRSAARRLLPRRVRRRRILAGPLRGRWIHASWRHYPRALLGRAEPELLGWFARHVGAGETWLDVGAYYGYTALALGMHVGPRGRVFAFEPMLDTAGALSLTVAANDMQGRIVVVPLALGNVESLTLRRDAARFRDMAHLRHPAPRGEAVYEIGLDRLWPSLCGDDTTVSGVKIDVQGMEADTLRGMATLLRLQRPRLIVEYHAYGARDALEQALVNAGYEARGRSLDGSAVPPAGAYRHGESYEFVPS